MIAPCTTLYQRRNKLGDGLDAMDYYKDNADIQHGADTRSVGISYQGNIAMGNFLNRQKPTYLDAVNSHYQHVIGDSYQLYGKNTVELEKEAEERARLSASKEAQIRECGADD